MEKPEDNIVEFVTYDGDVIHWDLYKLIKKHRRVVDRKKGMPFHPFLDDYSKFLRINPGEILCRIRSAQKKKKPDIREIKIGDITDKRLNKHDRIEIEIGGQYHKKLKRFRVGGSKVRSLGLDSFLWFSLEELDIRDASIRSLPDLSNILSMEGSYILIPAYIISDILCNNRTVIGNLDEVLNNSNKDVEVNLSDPDDDLIDGNGVMFINDIANI